MKNSFRNLKKWGQVEAVLPIDLQALAEHVQSLLKPRTVVLLTGPVGIGKTEFVKAFARLRGLLDIASPSFAIHHRYKGPVALGGVTGEEFDHLDLYRLENEDDLESSGFWDLFSQDKGLILIEWAEKLNWNYLPLNWEVIQLDFRMALPVSDSNSNSNSNSNGISQSTRVIDILVS